MTIPRRRRPALHRRAGRPAPAPLRGGRRPGPWCSSTAAARAPAVSATSSTTCPRSRRPAIARSSSTCPVTQSSKPSDVAYTLDFFVGALHAQLTALGIGPAVLLGNSLGGAIALKYALDHPDEVDGLIMMAPGGVEDRDTYFRMEGIRGW